MKAQKNPYRRILQADAADRRKLYQEIYAADAVSAERALGDVLSKPRRRRRIALYRRIIGPGHRAILEIGCGPGDLTHALGDLARLTVGVDVSLRRASVARRSGTSLDGNDVDRHVEFFAMNAISLGFRPESFDCAVSSSMIEHLHPDDVNAHLAEVLRVLRPGGRYLVWCPNRLGHHQDRNFHLCMMSYAELRQRMARAGFVNFRAPLFNWPPMVGVGFKVAAERMFSALGIKILWSHLGLRSICLVGQKANLEPGPGAKKRHQEAAPPSG